MFVPWFDFHFSRRLQLRTHRIYTDSLKMVAAASTETSTRKRKLELGSAAQKFLFTLHCCAPGLESSQAETTKLC